MQDSISGSKAHTRKWLPNIESSLQLRFLLLKASKCQEDSIPNRFKWYQISSTWLHTDFLNFRTRALSSFLHTSLQLLHRRRKYIKLNTLTIETLKGLKNWIPDCIQDIKGYLLSPPTALSQTISVKRASVLSSVSRFCWIVQSWFYSRKTDRYESKWDYLSISLDFYSNVSRFLLLFEVSLKEFSTLHVN